MASLRRLACVRSQLFICVTRKNIYDVHNNVNIINKIVNGTKTLKHFKLLASDFQFHHKESQALNRDNFNYETEVSKEGRNLSDNFDVNMYPAKSAGETVPSVNLVRRPARLRDENDTQRHLVVFVRDSMTSMKTTELYGLIRTMQPEEVGLQIKFCLTFCYFLLLCT